MSTSPQYTPAQILDMGQRAEQEGNLQYADQFYTYIVENFPETAEAAYARIGAQRVERATATSQQPPAPQPAPGAGQVAGPGPEVSDPTTAPPGRLSLNVSARPHGADAPPPGSATASHSPAQGQRPPGPAHQPQQQPQTPPPPAAQQRPEPSLAAPRAAPAEHEQQNRQPAPPQPKAGSIPPPRPEGQPPTLSAQQEADDSADDSPLPRVMRRDEDADEDAAEYVPGYRIGRFIAFTMVLLGWLALIAGIVFIAVAIAGVAGTQISQAYGGLPIGVVIGASAMASGVVMAFVGYIATAVFEAANNTRELLEIESAKAGW